VVLIAGKGHEDYQIIGSERNHFDDQEIAREILGKAGYNEQATGAYAPNQ
jgi:UDP-N-acetylmuramyl tripeptide synthase